MIGTTKGKQTKTRKIVSFELKSQREKKNKNREFYNIIEFSYSKEGLKHLIIILTFIAFTGLVALISWYKTKEENLSTKEGYFLAGRGLTGLVIAGSLEMTNLSTEQLVGQAGQSYSTNMGAMSWSVNASIALLALALIFLPKYLKAGITTIPEFLEVRFDRTTKQIISFLFLLGYMLTYLPTVLYSGALAFNQIFQLDKLFGITSFQSIAILCVAIGVIGSIYAIFGGLKAVAVSDTVNGVGLLIGGLLIPILSICILGNGSFLAGIQDFITNVPAEKFNAVNPANALPPMIPWPVLFLGMLFNNLFYWCTNQSIIQRTLAAKNLAQAQRGAVFTAFLKLLDPFFITICGLLAYRFFGDGLANSDLAYPSLIKDILPTPVLGFFAAVMFGAILSSFNSVLNSSMTLFTLDILPVISKKKRTDAQLITIAKRFGIVLCLASIIIAPFLLYLPAGISTFLNQMWGYYGVPVLAIVVMGILAPRMPSFAPKVAIIVHIVCYGLMMNLLPFHFLYFEVGAFVIDLILMAILTKAAPRKEAYVLPDLEVVDMTPWKYRKPVIAVTFILLAGIYVLFSPLGLGG